jgi:hypothetical protein
MLPHLSSHALYLLLLPAFAMVTSIALGVLSGPLPARGAGRKPARARRRPNAAPFPSGSRG